MLQIEAPAGRPLRHSRTHTLCALRKKKLAACGLVSERRPTLPPPLRECKLRRPGDTFQPRTNYEACAEECPARLVSLYPGTTATAASCSGPGKHRRCRKSALPVRLSAAPARRRRRIGLVERRLCCTRRRAPASTYRVGAFRRGRRRRERERERTEWRRTVRPSVLGGCGGDSGGGASGRDGGWHGRRAGGLRVSGRDQVRGRVFLRREIFGER